MSSTTSSCNNSNNRHALLLPCTTGHGSCRNQEPEQLLTGRTCLQHSGPMRCSHSSTIRFGLLALIAERRIKKCVLSRFPTFSSANTITIQCIKPSGSIVCQACEMKDWYRCPVCSRITHNSTDPDYCQEEEAPFSEPHQQVYDVGTTGGQASSSYCVVCRAYMCIHTFNMYSSF